MAQVAVIHGWSDKSASFEPMRAFLGRNGFQVKDIWLADYISLDDDVRVEDVAKRMQAVIGQMQAEGKLAAEFDMIVHSTGGLVVREWLATFYPDGFSAPKAGDPPGAARKKAPVKRIVMLAPANFGSRLAAVGKSMIGRLIKGLNNRLETGQQMLNALELASPYSFALAQRDLLRRPGETRQGPFGPNKVMPFVIVGTRAYDEGLQQVVNENGSDGTVRVSAASLNAVGTTIDFAAGPQPVVTPWESMLEAEVPLAVLPERDHGEITKPETDGHSSGDYGKRLSQLILRALRCGTAAEYAAITTDWNALSEETASLVTDQLKRRAIFGSDPGPNHFRQYLQVVVMVRDDYGNLIRDYFVEFYDPDMKSSKAAENKTTELHQKVLQAVHNNSQTAAYRCLYIDRTALANDTYNAKTTSIAVRISAAPPGRNIKYFDSQRDDATGSIIVHAATEAMRAQIGQGGALGARLFKNRTHLLEVIIPRRPVDRVFGLK